MSDTIRILTEGTKTEPAYFEALKGLGDVRLFELRAAKSSDPLKMLSEALQWRGDSDAETWLVLDAETPRQDATRHRRFIKCCEQAAKYGLRLAIAKPCFELWLLMHHEADIPSERLQQLQMESPQALARRLGARYDKGIWPELSREQVANALANAATLEGFTLRELVKRLAM